MIKTKRKGLSKAAVKRKKPAAKEKTVQFIVPKRPAPAVHFDALVIGLRGKRGSGKDYVTQNILVPRYGAKTYAYADRLRQVVHENYGVTYEQMLTPALKEVPLPEYPVRPGDPLAHIICDFFKAKFACLDLRDPKGQLYWTPRLLMIAEGQFKRAINPNYWSDYVHQKILKDKPLLAVISDARFPEGELKGLRRLGGKLVQITRTLENRGLKAELDDPSETLADAWTDWDGVWGNNSTLENLAKQVSTSMERFLMEKPMNWEIKLK